MPSSASSASTGDTAKGAGSKEFKEKALDEDQPCSSQSLQQQQQSVLTTHLSSASSIQDGGVQTELLVLIEQYLRTTPCADVAVALRRKIIANKLLPTRTDWTGVEHPISYHEFVSRIPQTQASLPKMLERLGELVEQAVPAPVKGTHFRLIASDRLSLARTKESVAATSRHNTVLDGIIGRDATVAKVVHNPLRMIAARSLGVRVQPAQLMGPQAMVQTMEQHFRYLGHLACVFCVAFDRSGDYVITGADDNLVKVWSVRTAMLRFTYRGHAAEIADISISHCNQVCASGSIDKTVRVWSLKNGETFHVYRQHTATVSVVSFVPYVWNNERYLISAAYDCTINFYKWTAGVNTFDPEPQRFFERTVGATRIVSACHSPGGNLVAVGDTHSTVRIYRISSDQGVCRLFELTAHADRVDSLVWANSGLRFASGSRDGLAKIWTFGCGQWKSVTLNALMEEFPPVAKVSEVTSRSSKNTYKVTMLCWTSDDRLVVTSGTDHVLRVWDPRRGRQLRYLQGHKDDAFVLSAHPVHANLIYSAGHDGNLIVWDVVAGVLVRRFQNAADGVGHMPIFDLALAADGTRAAVVDQFGNLTVFGLGSMATNRDILSRPQQQFFHTDYRPLIDDLNFVGGVIDDEHLIEPERMPPPKLVDQEGTPFPDETQRLVPGRENWDGVNENLECPWLTRNIVRPLPSGVYERELERITEVGDRECEEFLAEYHKREPEPAPPEVPLVKSERLKATATSGPRGGRVRRENGPNSNGRTSRQQASLANSAEMNQIPELFDSPEDSIYSSSEEESDSDSETDSSDSDFSIGARRSQERERSQPQELPPTSHGRRRRAPDTLESRQQTREVSKRRSRRNVPDEALEDIPEEEEDEAGPSTVQVKERKRGGRKRAKAEFPAWMNATVRRRFPYMAQLGDKVIYMKQGHEAYVNAVEAQNLYPVKGKMRPLSELDAEVEAVVDEVKYISRPYHLTALKLTRLDSNGDRTNFTWSVKYHDIENVLDFIVLKTHYDTSVERAYGAGDRIEAIVDDCWYLGRVTKVEPFEEQYPRSHWLCLSVCWDSGEEEKMSPWDCQPATQGRKTGPADEADHLAFADCPDEEGDWPPLEGADPYECRQACEQRTMSAITALVELETVAPFAKAVDLEEYPTYPLVVDYPIDLGTIHSRLENHFYRRVRALQQDIRYVALTAEQFNEPDSVIVRNSRVVVEALVRIAQDASITEYIHFYDSLFDLPESELIEFRRKQRTKSTVNVEEAAEPRNAGWAAESKTVLDSILADPCAQHFLRAGQIPELDTVFEVYPDLLTISDRLIAGVYRNPHEFKSEVEALVQGVRQMSDNKRSLIFRDSLKLSSKFEEAMQNIVARYERALQSVARQLEEQQLGRLRKRPSRHQNAYNTRSRDVRPEDEPGPSYTQSGRPTRALNNGYFRSLANGRVSLSPIMEEQPHQTRNSKRKHDHQTSEEGDTRDSFASTSRRETTDRRSARRGSTEERENGGRATRSKGRATVTPPPQENRRVTRSRREDLSVEPEEEERRPARRSRRRGGETTLETRESQAELQELVDDMEENMIDEEPEEEEEEEEEELDLGEEDEVEEDERPATGGRRGGRKRKREESLEEEEEGGDEQANEEDEDGAAEVGSDEEEEEEEEESEDEYAESDDSEVRRRASRRTAAASRSAAARQTTSRSKRRRVVAETEPEEQEEEDEEYGSSTGRRSRTRRNAATRQTVQRTAASARPRRVAAAARGFYAEVDEEEEEEEEIEPRISRSGRVIRQRQPA